LCCLGLGGISRAEENWPCFRGSNSGLAEDRELPVSWSTTENVKWKVDIPGMAWSSPIVWGDRIFLTTAAIEGEVAAPKKGLYVGRERRDALNKAHQWMVYCLSWKDGGILWKKVAHEGKPLGPVHVKNTYASETPVTDGERVYCYFGNIGVFCYDMDGKELWKKRFDYVKTRYNWGTAASPALWGDRLYVVNDNQDSSYLVGLEAATGKEVFRVERHEQTNWATPFVWKNAGRTELVTCGTGRIRSYDRAGKVLWELSGMSALVIPTPVTDGKLLYISSGFVMDRRQRPIYAIRPGASGDITPAEGQMSSEFIAWKHRFGGPYQPSPIVYGDYFYVLYDQGKLSCYRAKTGEIVYGPVRIAMGARAFTASPWASKGRIFFLSERGDTYVIKAGEVFKLLSTNALDEMCMATPAALRGAMLIRTLTKLYRIG
jgi:outer membrane protein assembly factor BamB